MINPATSVTEVIRELLAAAGSILSMAALSEGLFYSRLRNSEISNFTGRVTCSANRQIHPGCFIRCKDWIRSSRGGWVMKSLRMPEPTVPEMPKAAI